MTVNEVRSKYLAFFEKRGHAVIPSAPIVPENDPTTLFTSSGMQPLVPYLLGQEHPKGTRLVDSQLSFRAGDIEEVGDNRHTTFFEMLGNWSLGDYFKQEQLPWIFEFLTSREEGLGFDPQKLYVTVFDGDKDAGMDLDTEAVMIWERLYKERDIDAKLVRIGTEEEGYEKGMQGGRIFSYGAKKNWWSRSGIPANMPPGEPGGPDSEIFYDFGTPHDPRWGKECHVNCDCGRFVEICNSVFMQFVKNVDGTFSELPKRNVDFGGGLERLTGTSLSTSDVFLVDVFDAPKKVLEERSGKKYGESDGITKSYRIILDHTRAAAFFVATGIRPGNSEQGYILRRLIRRSLREADKLGITEPVLADVAAGFSGVYAEGYPFVQAAAQIIRLELEREEAQFRKTLTNGLRELEKMGDTIDAFTLFTTYGFPVELTAEIAAEKGIGVDFEAIEKQMEQHQALSRAGAAQKFAGGLADHAEQTVRYHTTHHILLKALQMVLGPDVHQRGSNITSERLRLDFSFGRKVTAEEIQKVEEIVNTKIKEQIPVIRTDMPKAEADKLGAEQEFGANYPDTVSVYSVGPLESAFSIEFCGGPHVSNTSDLKGTFKILKEEASSAGVRRIKAILENK
ncbi:MAG: alaS [Parcubacteria group bacterium]|nr:alaS [Parcubacteria group bacterium]